MMHQSIINQLTILMYNVKTFDFRHNIRDFKCPHQFDVANYCVWVHEPYCVANFNSIPIYNHDSLMPLACDTQL